MAELYSGDPPVAPEAAYTARRTAASRESLLGADADAWRAAHAITWGPVRYATAFRALWTDAALAIRFDATDDLPWHTWEERDDPLWEEEVVEIFLDPTGLGRNYAELEISPANVVCDLRVATPWPSLESHPAWDWEGLETRVHAAAGSPGGSWTAVAWLPWAGLRGLSGDVAPLVPPRPGDAWGFNVFRIKRPGGPGDPERGAVYAAWSTPPGSPSFHVPGAFRAFRFAA